MAPSFPWLIEALASQARSPNRSLHRSLLAVGGVDYYEPVDQTDVPLSNEVIDWDAKDANYELHRRPQNPEYLAGSMIETRYAMHCAADRPKVLLSGQNAGLDSVAKHLSKVDCAILSTHGGYRDWPRDSRTLERFFDPQLILSPRERLSPMDRNPFTKVSLALSGSYRRTGEALLAKRRPRSLTAHQVAHLPLENLNWVLLSACQSGLGDVQAGEEIFGLPAAFHLAGAENVISSLWSVSDAITTRLTMVFSYKVFREAKSPGVAWREAQLTYLRSPTELLSWDGTTPPPQLSSVGSQQDPTKPSKIELAKQDQLRDPYFWAAFQISGSGL